MLTLGRTIKQARAAQGLRQKDLQALTGITQKYLSRIENDQADPGWRTVHTIAHALQLDLRSLIADPPVRRAPAPPASPVPPALAKPPW